MIKNKNTLALFLFIPAGLLIISNLITVTAGFDAFVKMIICFSSGTIIFYGFKSAKGINETIIIFSLILILFNPVFPIHLEKIDKLKRLSVNNAIEPRIAPILKDPVSPINIFAG